ncbi:MAG TPA: hypothetical protein VF989_20215 [Polyangiaceae bacterium]
MTRPSSLRIHPSIGGFALALAGMTGAACSGGGTTSGSDGASSVGAGGGASAAASGATASAGGGPSTASAVSAGGSTASGMSAGAGGSAAGVGGAASSTGGTAGTAGSGGSGGMPLDPNDRSAEGVCARWNADRQNLSEGTWSGSIEGCVVGDISAEGRANALRLFNLYRWLADLPPVETSPERDEIAQACALLQEANWRSEGLSHGPPESWDCYSDEGREGSATSNISGGPGVSSVSAYLLDRGNEDTMGHRRIILANWLGPIGLGSTADGASCMQNLNGDGNADKEWMAWPPPGFFPLQAYGGGNTTLSDTGWSVQSEDIDVREAEITVSSAAGELAVDTEPLEGNYGFTDGIRIVPNAWDVEAGQTYAVSLSGLGTPIAYEFTLVDCE